tara:strand:- start:1220 stop:1393 length:174 start_codon:yes stop_codon:yes gene_type:complete
MKTIDMTPTWVQVVDILIMTLQSKADSDSMVHAQKELTKMARLADNWVKHVKETESV